MPPRGVTYHQKVPYHHQEALKVTPRIPKHHIKVPHHQKVKCPIIKGRYHPWKGSTSSLQVKQPK
jgi:hypothetical protein